MNEQKMDRSDIHDYEFANLTVIGSIYYSFFRERFERKVDRKWKKYCDSMGIINEQVERLSKLFNND